MYQGSMLQYDVMDVCERIDYPNNSVDLIIDKGLLDAVLCGEGFLERVNRLMSECWRVLKPKGVCMVLS